MTAQTIYDSTTQPPAAGGRTIYDNIPGFSFMTNGSFSPATFYSYTTGLFDATPNDGGSVTLYLYSSSPYGYDPITMGPAPAPGTQLATLGTIADSSLSATGSLINVALPANLQLAANTRYWIVETATSNSKAEDEVASGTSGTGVAGQYTYYEGFTYPNGAVYPVAVNKIVVSNGPNFAITAPPAGSTGSIIDPTIAGVGNAGDGVTVTYGPSNTVLGSTVIAANGTWSVKEPFPADGTYTVTATDTTDGPTANDTLTIDSTPNKPLFGTTTYPVSSVAGQVYALYQTILGRAPDPLGFETQVAAVEAGASLQSVAQGLLTSAEYANDYGSTVASNSGFINQLYEDGLHRPADAGGQQAFGDQLANGTSRAEVAVEIATSPESQNDLAPTFANGVFVPVANDSAVARLYYGVLGRAPDAAGLQSDEMAVDNGTTIGQVIQGMLGSQEYQGTTVGQDNLDFIQNLYQTALNRPGDAAGLQAYETGLDTGSLSRAQVADDFLTGTEFQSDEAGQSNASYVNAVFEAALGRAADPSGSAYWQNQLNNGVSRSQVAEDIVGSSEFASNYTAPGQAEFVTQLYEGALGRAPAASETQAWQTALNNGASLEPISR